MLIVHVAGQSNASNGLLELSKLPFWITFAMFTQTAATGYPNT